MRGQSDRAAGVVQRASDRLANPPRGIGAEPESAGRVVLVDRSGKADAALLDQVQEVDVLVAVLLRHEHDQAEVRPDHVVPGGQVPSLYADRQLVLLAACQERGAADLVEILGERVGHRCASPRVRIATSSSCQSPASPICSGTLYLSLSFCKHLTCAQRRAVMRLTKVPLTRNERFSTCHSTYLGLHGNGTTSAVMWLRFLAM